MQGYWVDCGIAVPVVGLDPASWIVGYDIPLAGTYECECVEAKPQGFNVHRQIVEQLG